MAERLNRLNQWEVTVAYPFLMRALDSVVSGDVNESDFVEVIRLIESYVIRRTVCGVATNQLRRIFATMSSQVEFTNQFYATAREHLEKNRWPEDAEFRTKFIEFELYSSSRVRGDRLNLVLWTLERAFGHKETPEPSNNITIEHIMPQTLTEEWKAELGADASEVHRKWLHTIGNLTLSGYNPSMSNKPFSEKKLAFAEANFALSKSINSFGTWNETSIQRRGEMLADIAVKIWKR